MSDTVVLSAPGVRARCEIGTYTGAGGRELRYGVVRAPDERRVLLYLHGIESHGGWFLAAAEQGLPRAQIKIAEIYAGESEIIPGSSVKACGWFLLAAATLRGAQLERAQSAYQRASSKSPCDSTSAFLQSIIPAPVSVRSWFTSFELISMTCLYKNRESGIENPEAA